MPNSPDDDSGHQKASNLARIRDNQRRSRQRRKDYIQELEAKAREFDMQGVKASSEMQTAARKVLDENKRLQDEVSRLRNLLLSIGVNETEIDHAAAGTSGASSVHEPALASPTFQQNLSATRESLEALLVTRTDASSSRRQRERDPGTLFRNQASESRLDPRTALLSPTARQIPSLLRTPSNQSEQSGRRNRGVRLARSSRSTSFSDEAEELSSVTSAESAPSASLATAAQEFYGMNPVSYSMSMGASGWHQPTAYPMGYSQTGAMTMPISAYDQPFPTGSHPGSNSAFQSVLSTLAKPDEYHGDLQYYPSVTYPSSSGDMSPWG
ncbi:hypothetical protein BT63DRAFT_193238 [Microthyrium microscopicum]|uniref:BZIP domain-containing protein n=1 Tax=Microthyrium microscopicum TaxID=703497 RepID=A0A6A6UJ94_9PEZI|nr:hypothetical protein BT63DRAFT_193238 [Microthyrium microscopicum]